MGGLQTSLSFSLLFLVLPFLEPFLFLLREVGLFLLYGYHYADLFRETVPFGLLFQKVVEYLLCHIDFVADDLEVLEEGEYEGGVNAAPAPLGSGAVTLCASTVIP